MNGFAWTSLGYRTGRRSLARTLSALALVSVLASPCSVARAQAAAETGTPAAAADGAQTNEIHVAAAADMEPVFQVFGPIFERKTGMKLKVSFASSATLAQQIRQGAPMDIFFSADFYFAEQVVADKLTDTRQPIPYARGILELYSRKDSRFKPLNTDVLSRKDLKSVAVANPDRAPYGRAGIAALKHMKVWDNVAPHIVQAESVAQAAQFALSGNAEIAIISRTLAVSPKYRDVGNFALFPLDQYPTMKQTAVIMKAGKNNHGAHLLLNYMLSDEVQGNLPKLGLQPAQ